MKNHFKSPWISQILIPVLVGIIINIIWSLIMKESVIAAFSNSKNWVLFFSTTNLMVLFAFLFVLKSNPEGLNFVSRAYDNDYGYKNYDEYYQTKNAVRQISSAAKIKQANVSVRQFSKNMHRYAYPLIIAYGIYVFLHFFPNFKNFALTSILLDALNYISGVFVFLNFRVLHDDTVDENGEPIKYNNGIWLFTMAYVALYVILHLVASEHKESNNILSLIAGLMNGFVMIML